jgi:hypothetical protein
MKLSEFKQKLQEISELKFSLSNETLIPAHFHITEIGLINKKYIDCGGTFREELKINFQIWVAQDIDHRLSPQKLLHIIQASSTILEEYDTEIEVEYQMETIGKYDLAFEHDQFILEPKFTNCLAQDQCGIPIEKPKMSIHEIIEKNNCCTSNGICC